MVVHGFCTRSAFTTSNEKPGLVRRTAGDVIESKYLIQPTAVHYFLFDSHKRTETSIQ